MKQGETEVETLRINGWGVGDVLEGDDGFGVDRIKITAIGEQKFLCKWDYKATGVYSDESGATTLRCRGWKKVS